MKKKPRSSAQQKKLEARAQWLSEALRAKNAVVHAACAFQDAMEVSAKKNTRDAEDAVDRAMERLRTATVRLQKLKKKGRKLYAGPPLAMKKGKSR